MSSQNASLTSKLTLVVLTLILVCLAMLVARVYRSPETAGVESSTSADERLGEKTLQPPLYSSGRSFRATTNNLGVKPVAPASASGLEETPISEPPNSSASYSPSGGAGSTFLPVIVTVEEDPNGDLARRPRLKGFVTLVGTPKPEIQIPMGSVCGNLHPGSATTRHYVVNKNGGLANVFVSLQNARATRVQGMGPTLDQVGCMFEPYVLGVVVDQRFRIKNSDPTLHNVHATPKLNKEFNIGQPHRGQVIEKSFSKAEPFLRIKCDVHPWMFAYIGVFDHPFFATTDTNGMFWLPTGFPAGEYVVSAAHLRAGEILEQVRIAEGEEKVLHFQFDLSSPNQPRGGVVSAQP